MPERSEPDPDRSEPAAPGTGPERDETGSHEPESDAPVAGERPELVLNRRLVELALERTRLARKRTEMSADRSRMSAERSEMSAERSYMNAERTLSVWVRTALAVIVVGIAADRFGLLMRENHGSYAPDSTASTVVGAGLVALGVLIAAVTAVRFRRYAAAYRRTHAVPEHHGPFMAPLFAGLVALFGVVLFILLIVGP